MSLAVTGPVDPAKPMELDDGRPVELMTIAHDGTIAVLFTGSPHRDSDAVRERDYWNYSPDTGVWMGGNAEEQCVLRNVRDPTMHSPFKRRRRKLCL